MGLSFGNSVPVMDVGYRGPPLSFGNNAPKLNTSKSGFGWLNWGNDVYDSNLGTPIVQDDGWASPYSTPGVDWSGRPGAGSTHTPANPDSASGFFAKMATLGDAVLNNAGQRSERAPNPMLQQASYDPNAMSVGGVNVTTLAIVGLVGVGVYLAYRN